MTTHNPIICDHSLFSLTGYLILSMLLNVYSLFSSHLPTWLFTNITTPNPSSNLGEKLSQLLYIYINYLWISDLDDNYFCDYLSELERHFCKWMRMWVWCCSRRLLHTVTYAMFREMLRVQGNSIAKLKTDLSLKPYPFALNHNCTFTQESVMCDSTAVVQ